MKENQDIPDKRLSLAFGEAMAQEPSHAETLAAWDAFEKKHSEEFGQSETFRDDVLESSVLQPHKKNTFKTKLVAIVVGMAVAASLLLFFFAPSQEANTPAKSPLELYAEQSSPMQMEQTLQDGMCKVSTPAATTTLLTLADGTKVTLNANSTLEYPQNFIDASERRVRLSGEAYFEVTKNPHRPFIVEAGEMQTKVLGTVFDVKAYSIGSPRVTLLEGKVKVSNQDTSVDIAPGQTATLRSSQIIISKSPADEATTSWLHGDFDMDQVSLADAMSDIGAWYNKTVLFKSKANMDKQIHFRFSRKASLSEVLTAINELGVARIEMKAGKIMVE